MNRCDIIIPVFNAYESLKKCVDSAIKNTDLNKARLILIDDKSTDNRILPLLRKYEKNNPKKVILLVNKKNLGFVKTANKGLKYSKNDVLLLNSDTEVFKGWLKKIIDCAYNDKNIATVTPFSNNLTPIKPLPESFRKEGFPKGRSLDWMAKLVGECSMHNYPELPTGHGFCLFIKREALEKVGFLDEKTFGKGYGEENDFCFKCLKYGYRHILCDDVYVFHKGTQSFLNKKRLHNDELVKKHPKIMNMVSEWYEKGDIGRITDNIVLAIGSRNNRKNVLVLAKNGFSEKRKEILKEMREKYNLHVLEIENGNYVLHSFFKDVDLKTAIYEKNVDIRNDNKINNKILGEIKEIFGISAIVDFDNMNNKQIIDECEKNKGKKRINFLRVREKMLEYDFVQGIIKNINMEETKAKDASRAPMEMKKRRFSWKLLRKRLN